MSHIKDRLSDYHDFMKKLADDHQMVLASDVLEMIEQIKDDLEQDEKENGWIPVSERVPEEMTSTNYLVTIKGYGVDIANYVPITKTWYCLSVPCEVIAWKPLPEPMKEDDV